MRIKDTDICSFCTEIDTISHFFYKCHSTGTFWDRLSSWCESYLDFSIAHLSELEIKLGVVRAIPNLRVINWLILCAKFYIQKRKLFSGAEVSIIGFLAEIRLKLLTEKRVCMMEHRPQKFRVWKQLFEALG